MKIGLMFRGQQARDEEGSEKKGERSVKTAETPYPTGRKRRDPDITEIHKNALRRSR